MALPAAVLASLIPGAIKAGTSVYQGLRAKQMRDKFPRPEYQIPMEAGELAAASRLAYNDPNLYARNIAAQQIDSASAFGAGRAMDTGRGTNEVLATIAALNQNSNQQLGNLAVEGELRRQDRFNQMANSLSQMAGYRDQAYYENQKEPYENAQNAAAALAGASMQNMYGAAQDIADIGSKLFPLGDKGSVSTAKRGTAPVVGGGMSQSDINKTIEALEAQRKKAYMPLYYR